MRIQLMPALIFGMLVTPMFGFSQTITIGEEFKGELKTTVPAFALAPGGNMKVPFMGFGDKMYIKGIPIELKEGQSVSITMVVTGQNRKAALSLVDSGDSVIKTTFGDENPDKRGQMTAKTSKLEIIEAPSTGTYTINVFSNQMGGFTLFVKDSKGTTKRDAKTVQAELDSTLKKAEELKRELRDLQKKN